MGLFTFNMIYTSEYEQEINQEAVLWGFKLDSTIMNLGQYISYMEIENKYDQSDRIQ